MDTHTLQEKHKLVAYEIRVSGVEIRDNIGMSRVKQTPQNMT